MTRQSPLPRTALLHTLATLVLAAPAVLPATRMAMAQGTSEQRAACTSDAMRLCLSALPDVGRITTCMKAHYGELSPRCQASFNDERAAPPRKQAEEPAAPKPSGEAAGQTRQAETKPAEAKPAETRRVEVKRPEPKRVAVRHPEAEPAEPPRDASRRAARVRDLAARQPARELPRREAPAPLEVAPPPAPPPARVATARVFTEVPIGAPTNSFAASNSNLATACRLGLIDAFTCGNTIPALGLDK